MTSSNKRQKMRLLSDYKYWKFHFECMIKLYDDDQILGLKVL